MVYAGELAAVGARLGDMALLRLGWRGVMFVGKAFLRGGGARIDAAVAAVIADVRIVHDDGLLVHVADDVHVYVVHVRVIEKVAVGPAAAEVAGADVTETVIDAAVETDFRSPVARVPKIWTRPRVTASRLT